MRKFILTWCVVPLFCLAVSAQCAQNVYTPAKCPGDEVAAVEKTLVSVVNSYRIANGLKPVTLSPALSVVANRHLIDLVQNVKYLSHGWSDCAYDIKKEATWNCLFEAPKRAGVAYAGDGYENLYRKNGGPATPAEALEAWKKSPLHNNLIINKGAFAGITYDAMGVAVSGEYAALWFGSTASSEARLNVVNSGIGLSYKDITEGLAGKIGLRKVESLDGGNARWIGATQDKSVRLEITGTEKEVSGSTMKLTIALAGDRKPVAGATGASEVFVGNIGGEPLRKWFADVTSKLAANPAGLHRFEFKGREVEARVDGRGLMVLTIRPKGGVKAVEL